MSISLPSSIFNLKGQVVKEIKIKHSEGQIVIDCQRDQRYQFIDPRSQQVGTVNQYIRRQVKDIPLLGHQCIINIELAQVQLSSNERRIEACDFVESGRYYTNRFCRLISGLCRHMSIQAVSKYFNIRWGTVKNIDKQYLKSTLPSLDPKALRFLKYIGVDEVARAKGHDYMTVVYDMVSGQLIWVEKGRTSDIFSSFLKLLQPETAKNIEAVAMDMGPTYQKSVRECLPNAAIVFDRFHVMQNYSKAISNQRRIEFRKADNPGKELIKGSKFLLLKNADKLNEKQKSKLEKLLKENVNINLMYVLKEQLQTLWLSKSFEEMASALETWCQLADDSEMPYMKKFAKSLRKNKVGICNYATHPLNSARIEAGNVGIGMIRKRARGIRDTGYFKLKIRQLSAADDCNIFYQKAR